MEQLVIVNSSGQSGCACLSAVTANVHGSELCGMNGTWYSKQ